mmetsp:Transcript_17530/g.24723  ORF Transcript_17530/g.24723 Transcript_17530/m.24723 type:complete len:239 (+) Transcript_17530:97-813(+)
MVPLVLKLELSMDVSERDRGWIVLDDKDVDALVKDVGGSIPPPCPGNCVELMDDETLVPPLRELATARLLSIALGCGIRCKSPDGGGGKVPGGNGGCPGMEGGGRTPVGGGGRGGAPGNAPIVGGGGKPGGKTLPGTRGMDIPPGIVGGGKGGGGGGGGGGSDAIRMLVGSVRRQSSSSSNSLYPWAAKRAKAARHAQSIAASRVLPLPQDRSVPPTRVEKTRGLSAVAPLPGGCTRV